MLNVRVHSAVAEQSEEMQLPGSSALHCLLKQGHAWQLLVRNQQINARDVHVHDAPCAHVHVPHFAITHLAFGQSDKRPGGMNQSVWKFLDQFVIRRLARQRDGVPLGLRAVSPSIEHSQHNRLRSFCHSASEYMDSLDESLCFRHDICWSVSMVDSRNSRVASPGSIRPVPPPYRQSLSPRPSPTPLPEIAAL